MIYEKIDNKSFKGVEQTQEESVFNLDSLKEKRQAHLNEIARIDTLILEAGKLGIK